MKMVDGSHTHLEVNWVYDKNKIQNLLIQHDNIILTY